MNAPALRRLTDEEWLVLMAIKLCPPGRDPLAWAEAMIAGHGGLAGAIRACEALLPPAGELIGN